MVWAALRLDLPEAPRALCDVLDVRLGATEPPIRAEIFGPQRFAQHGHSLGLTHRARRQPARVSHFFPRLRHNIAVLRQARRYIGLQAATGHDISPAGEWLLDNFHLIETQIEEVREGLPRRYFGALPVLQDPPLEGLPRVYGVAWAFVAHTDSDFDEDLLVQFLQAYQEARELTLGEMWALATTLRVVLIENLRRLAERVATHKAARAVANLCCDHLDRHPPAALDRLLARLQQRGVGRHFLGQLALRLQDPGAALPVAPTAEQRAWLQQALPDAAAQAVQNNAEQAADNLSVSNAVAALRAIGAADWPDIVARSSLLMQMMLGSPLFEAEHSATRDQSLHAIERLARQSRRSEVAVARVLLSLMQPARAGERAKAKAQAETDATVETDIQATPGHWLLGAGRPALRDALGLHAPWLAAWQAHRAALALPAYLATLALGTAALVAWLLMRPGGAAATGWVWLVGLLMLGPASEAVVAIVNRLVSESAQPAALPRLALATGIPASHRVMVVVPCMLTSAQGTADLAHRLRLHHLANPEGPAQFALLSDWADADAAQAPGDTERLAEAMAAIEALNRLYPQALAPDQAWPAAPRFVLLHRPRRFCQTEGRWLGWERKRGKLEQLVALLAEPDDAVAAGHFMALGDTSRTAAGTRYLLTLDSDTQLPPGRLRELVGVAMHPANQPRLADDGLSVARGYAMLQPRVVTPLPSLAEATRFHTLFAGQCGIDPYSAATSEVYQDLFGEGSFSGKGLFDVPAVHAVLAGRLPEGQVLSHDLIEGSLARCAAVSDVTVVEDSPFHADVAAARLHRWTRGDWQLLPLLMQPRRYPLRGINRWKLLDNLRRSLVAPMSLALLMLALAGVAGSPGAVLALVMAALLAGPLMGAVAGLAPSRDDLARRHFFMQAGADLLRAVAGGLWLLQQLLQQASLAADAIVRTVWRLAVSRRHLLQWTPFAATVGQARQGAAGLLGQHHRTPLAAIALLGGLLALGTPTPWLAVALCGLWASGPLGIAWVSRPRPARRDALLSDPQQAVLHAVARDTWRYFERCVTAADHHLPPDNLQTLPHEMLARRTSPTNIGLYLLSAACARQFGWIGSTELANRCEATLATLGTLQRHRGHFLNWYDTATGAPLLPMYVSTVDSGNLGGHLLALAQACTGWAVAPLDAQGSHAALARSVLRLRELLARRCGGIASDRAALRAALADHRAMRASAALDAPAGQSDAAAARQRTETSARLLAIAQRCEQLAYEADYRFLYHPRRRLLHIGFRLAEQQLDAGFYDLLASESRLTSLLAIAKGDVPVRHWAALGRPFEAVGTAAGLRSWSGSMFEYLMPTLVLAEPPGSVLREACRAAVRRQISYTRPLALPWGISESAYAARDHTLAYQYAPQGVPTLALRRTPPDELVIAPYATVLAAQVAPHRAWANLATLAALGARGRLGFIEALDCTPARQSGGLAITPVAAYMAHHQGMSIVALANVLLDNVAQRWGMATPGIEAVASLLHERPPRELARRRGLDQPTPPPPQAAPAASPQRLVLPGASALPPTHLLGNGRYHVALRANGAGFSRWRPPGAGTPVDITRWRDDLLRDEHGSFLWLRGGRLQAPASLTQHPAPDPRAQYQSEFHADRVCFQADWPGLRARTTVWVSPEDDIEFREVALHNDGDSPLTLELLSCFDVALSEARADESHPAFTGLFVTAQWQPSHQALVFSRTPRLASEPSVHAAHFLTDVQAPLQGLRVQVDRQRWRGRNQATAQPLWDLDSVPDGQRPGDPARHLTTGLDPVCALAVRLHIAPGGKAQLTFATAVAPDAGRLQALVDRYRQSGPVQRASLMSATLSGIRLRTLGLAPEPLAALQSLSTALLYTLTRSAPGSQGSTGPWPGHCDKRLLWRFGLSGDRPLILVQAAALQGLGLVRTLVQALRLWAWGGLACDLVVLNSEPASYLMPLQQALVGLRDRLQADLHADALADPLASQPGSDGADTRGALHGAAGLHLLRPAELSPDELATLRAMARVRLDADGRPLVHPVQAWLAAHELALQTRQDMANTALPAASAPQRKPAVPTGDFDPVTGAFGFAVGADQRPQRPWTQVLANPDFGCLVTESGGGYSWAGNSRLHQLTAWYNDPVADPTPEWWLLQDRRTLHTWSATPNAAGAAGVRYHVAHAAGTSTISHQQGDLAIELAWCVDADAAVRQVTLRVHNTGNRSAALRWVSVTEWLLGAQRSDRATVHTRRNRQRLRQPMADTGHSSGTRERDARDSSEGGPWLTTLLATQADHAGGFGQATAFVARVADDGADDGDDDSEDWTCDRREFFDARGHAVLPDHLGRLAGSGLDPCAALSIQLKVPPGQVRQQVVLMGHAASPEAAQALALHAASRSPARRLAAVQAQWQGLLGATTVATPDPLFDALVNHWLLYQAVACRMWAKAGFYQAGGATGFRDQLQDSLALAWAAPQLLRAQILRCAARQFVAGDVQHWWHEPGGAGVRTHFSDDLLWLPWASVHHLQCTGDGSLLDELVPFLDGEPLPAGVEDRYDSPTPSDETATVYEHGARAIDRSLRVGAHGLPLIGTGDWNDGLNRVGHGGQGESVWLAWMLCRLVADYAPLARARGEHARAQRWTDASTGWQAALHGPAWDGRWFKRAFFDDGQALGSHANDEARIDLIAQAWAVLSGVADPLQARQAMLSARTHLQDDDAGLLRLLHPPLAHSQPSPGYIQAYPPGVRENGGQYTHGAVWGLMALAALQVQRLPGPLATADADLPWQVFTQLSPAHRSSHPTRGPVYGLEPYAVAADVYSAAPYVGRGGWSWYTGSAAWLHRAAVESIFGLKLDARDLRFEPCLPSHWPRAEITLRRGARSLHFILARCASVDALASQVPAQAQVLWPGQYLAWAEGPAERCFVVPLLDNAAPMAPSAPVAPLAPVAPEA